MSTGLALVAGALLVGGLAAVLSALLPRTPQLTDALAGLSDDPGSAGFRGRPGPDDLGGTGSRTDRLGSWCYRVSPIPLTARQRQNLQINNRSVAEFFADKLVLAVIGLVLPTFLVGLVIGSGGDLPPAVPFVVALAGLVLGYFVPDLLLRSGSARTRQDAAHALLTYIDLVTLERLANASATQALQNAADVSDVALFVRIRTALERAQLEQQSPYAELRRLADQLALPELGDLVDVMQLDEAGASLAGTLRARVRELRNAHLTKEQQEANAVSESMTIFMTIPALIFGLFFMVPPLLRIAGP